MISSGAARQRLPTDMLSPSRRRKLAADGNALLQELEAEISGA